MNEKELTRILRSSLKFVWAGLVGFFYALGGADKTSKAWRRYGASFLACLGVVGFSLWSGQFNWWFLLYWPLLVGALSLGYGADETGKKVAKRLMTGSAIGTASLPIAIVTGNYLVFAFHLFLCIITSIYWGVLNPVNANNEETIIGGISVLFALFMVA